VTPDERAALCALAEAQRGDGNPLSDGVLALLVDHADALDAVEVWQEREGRAVLEIHYLVGQNLEAAERAQREIERLRDVAARDDGLVLCDCERGHIVALACIGDRAAGECPLCERDDARDAEHRAAARLVEATAQIRRLADERNALREIRAGLSDRVDVAEATMVDLFADLAEVKRENELLMIAHAGKATEFRAERDEARAAARDANDRLDKVRALHQPGVVYGLADQCLGCHEAVPDGAGIDYADCPTIRALETSETTTEP
jgi:hypothetical protein